MRPRIVFVTGFHRSGTTVTAEAIAKTLDFPVLTVADLSPYLPAVATLLASLESSGSCMDRSVDARRLTPTLPEEYSWYLAAKARVPRLWFRAVDAPALRTLAASVARRAGRASLRTARHQFDRRHDNRNTRRPW